jgi:tripartite-type tricarboxylate transporter receptor subunit TctC
MKLKKIAAVVLAVAAMTTSAFAAYPTKKITLICPYSAGGTSDIGDRQFGRELEKLVDKPVIVENTPGASGWIAWNKLGRSKPDGYTISEFNLTYIAGYLNPATKRNMNLDSVTLLANHVIDYTAWGVRADSKFNNMTELLAYVKEHPGEIKVATTGLNTQHHLLLIELERLGYKMEPVHTKGASDALTMALGGHVDIVSLGAGYLNKQVKEGSMKALAVFSPEPSTMIPGVPTMKEQTGLDLVTFAARGFAAPANLDPEALKVLDEACKKIMSDPEYVKRLADLGFEVRYMGSDDYKPFLLSVEKQYKEAFGW